LAISELRPLAGDDVVAIAPLVVRHVGVAASNPMFRSSRSFTTLGLTVFITSIRTGNSTSCHSAAPRQRLAGFVLDAIARNRVFGKDQQQLAADANGGVLPRP
jgi:hypothetical protein